jgi:hypothetical protein
MFSTSSVASFLVQGGRMPSGGVWRRAAQRRREEVARSRVLGAVAVGWLLTLLPLAFSILVLSRPSLAFLRGGAVFLLVVGLIMVGVTELVRRANQIAIGTLLAAMVLSQVRAWRALHGSMLGWDTIIVAIIIGVLANGLWGAFQLDAVRRETAMSGSE